MKKRFILTLCFLLASCSNTTPVDSTSESSKIDESISLEASTMVESSSVEESVDKVVNLDSIEIGVSQKYHLISLFNEEYQNAIVDYEIGNEDVIAIDINDNIIGKTIGTSTLTVTIDFEPMQTIDVNVIDETEAFLKMQFNPATLYGKNITIFGDSISDNSVTAYPENKPKFWVELLEDYDVGNIYNHAKSGATVGYSVSMQNAGALDIVATNVVNQKQTKEDVKKSDYAFILIGTNDFFRQVTKGNADDINDSNYKTVESFVGSYTYLIKKIYETNPNIKIICLSTTASTWGLDTQTEYKNKEKCIQTRPLMNEEIRKIAAANNAMYINLYDLFDGAVTTYCPDGIHPQSRGYQMIIERIMSTNK